MKIFSLHNLIPKTDLNKILNKNFLENMFIKSVYYKFVILVIKISSKV